MVGALITILLYCIIVGIIIWLVNYLVDNLPIAEPFGRIAKILAIVVGAIVIILLLLSLADTGPWRFPRL